MPAWAASCLPYRVSTFRKHQMGYAIADRVMVIQRNSVNSSRAAVPPKTSPAAVFHSTERHLRLVVNRRTVNVAHARFEPLGRFHRLVNVTAEDRAREAVF